MSIDSRHPDFRAVEEDYRVMRDSFAGQRVIKEARTAYLPATSGQIADGALLATNSLGAQAYNAYLTRAVYPGFVREAVNTLVGVLHREPSVIELPPQLEPLRKSATRDHESLDQLLRRINEQQLLFGRYGILADVEEGAVLPHLVPYKAETIINWDDERFDEFQFNELTFLVLNETAVVRGKQGADVFDWSEERRFRVALIEPEEGFDEDGNAVQGDDVYKTFTETDNVRSGLVVPNVRGRTIEEIPWVFIGANDLVATPDEIPLLPLAELALAAYRGEADYRQSLFMQGQDTLVVIGEDAPDEKAEKVQGGTKIGAGAKISVPLQGDAKFIGVDSKGLTEQRTALENDYRRAREMGSRLLEPRGSQAESAEALRVRIAGATATLQQVALTGAAGLEKILRICAKWIGVDPGEDDSYGVHVRPNLDFAENREDPAGLVQLMTARSQGAPMSLRSIHRWMQENDFTRKDFEEEVAEIMAEMASAELRKLTPMQPTTPEPGGSPPEDEEDDEGPAEE